MWGTGLSGRGFFVQDPVADQCVLVLGHLLGSIALHWVPKPQMLRVSGPGMPALSATSPTGCVCVCNDKGSGHKVIFLLRVILLINFQLAGILLY